MPRRNNRDRRYEPKEYNNNEGKFTEDSEYNTPSKKGKPVRRRKDKWDKNIYRENE